MSTRRRVSSASTINRLEKCSLVDLDQGKSSVIFQNFEFLKYFWHKNIDVNQQKSAGWLTSIILRFSMVDVDGQRQRLHFSWLTTGSPFHHAQNFFLLNLKIAEYTVLALNGTSFLYLRNLALNYKCVFVSLSLSLSLSLSCMKKPFLLMMYH